MYFIVSGSLVCTLNDKELERLTKGQVGRAWEEQEQEQVAAGGGEWQK